MAEAQLQLIELFYFNELSRQYWLTEQSQLGNISTPLSGTTLFCYALTLVKNKLNKIYEERLTLG